MRLTISLQKNGAKKWQTLKKVKKMTKYFIILTLFSVSAVLARGHIGLFQVQ